MDDRPEWFAPKRYGYGAGLPISTQGWALLLGYLVLLGLSSLVIRLSWLAYASLVVTLTAGFIVIVARTTKDGWRWRWGDKD